MNYLLVVTCLYMDHVAFSTDDAALAGIVLKQDTVKAGESTRTSEVLLS